MTATRAIRETPVRGDPWPLVEAWAARARYRAVESDTQRRLYRKGRGWTAPTHTVLILAAQRVVHIEAWVAPGKLAQGSAPPELSVEPGGFIGSFPRRKARSEVNALLEALGAAPITDARDPDDRGSTTVMAGIAEATRLADSGDFEASRSTWDEILPVAEHLFGSLHGIPLTGRLDRAVVLLETGETERALTDLEDLVPSLLLVLGRDDPATLNAKEALAVALWACGRQREGQLAQRTVDAFERAFGTDDPRTIELREKVASPAWPRAHSDGSRRA